MSMRRSPRKCILFLAKNAFNSAGHSCLWAILRGLGVPDVDFFEDLQGGSGK